MPAECVVCNNRGCWRVASHFGARRSPPHTQSNPTPCIPHLARPAQPTPVQAPTPPPPPSQGSPGSPAGWAALRGQWAGHASAASCVSACATRCFGREQQGPHAMRGAGKPAERSRAALHGRRQEDGRLCACAHPCHRIGSHLVLELGRPPASGELPPPAGRCAAAP